MQRERASGDIPCSLYVDAFVVHVWWCLPLLRNLSVQKVIECALEKPPPLTSNTHSARVWNNMDNGTSFGWIDPRVRPYETTARSLYGICSFLTSLRDGSNAQYAPFR